MKAGRRYSRKAFTFTNYFYTLPLQVFIQCSIFFRIITIFFSFLLLRTLRTATKQVEQHAAHKQTYNENMWQNTSWQQTLCITFQLSTDGIALQSQGSPHISQKTVIKANWIINLRNAFRTATIFRTFVQIKQELPLFSGFSFTLFLTPKLLTFYDTLLLLREQEDDSSERF